MTFRDQVQKGEKVADTYEVESYKKYNAIEGSESGDFSCKCNIFWKSKVDGVSAAYSLWECVRDIKPNIEVRREDSTSLYMIG